MKRAVLAALLLAPAFGGARAAAQYMGGAAPSAPGIISMSLMEALVAVEHPELAGIFAYVPEQQTAVAMADFLMRDHASLKRYLKRVEKDARKLKVVNGWDKEVCLHIVAATANHTVPPGAKPLKKSLYDRVSNLSLAQGVSLQIILQRRAEVR